MSKTLIGIVSFGGLPFLELCLRGIRETLTKQADVIVIIAKPDDSDMRRSLDSLGVRYIQHNENKGFPASVNDIYDAAFVNGDYDQVIFMGNDTVPMVGCLDGMIECADTTDWEMGCASEFNSRFLVNNYPEAKQYFHGDNLIFTDFSARPWELHKDFREPEIQPDTRKDIRNCALFKRSAFEKVGYDDVAFWPNGYYADNDYARRCDLLGVSAAGLPHCAFFHFWSRSIHQGNAGNHGHYFDKNANHYSNKWGGTPGHETREPELKISSREHEASTIEAWR